MINRCVIEFTHNSATIQWVSLCRILCLDCPWSVIALDFKIQYIDHTNANSRGPLISSVDASKGSLLEHDTALFTI